MPSSVNVGVRPSMATIRSYSSWFRLCSRTNSGVMAGSPPSATGCASGAMMSATLVPPRPECAHDVAEDSAEQSRLLGRSGELFELVGVEPHAAAVVTRFHRDPLDVPAGQVVAILGALHQVLLSLGGGALFREACPLGLHQFGLLASEVFVFVMTGLVGHGRGRQEVGETG